MSYTTGTVQPASTWRKHASGGRRGATLVVATITAATFLAACGGGSSSSTTANAGPTSDAGQTSAPTAFQGINAQVASAIAAVEPKLDQTVQRAGEFDAADTTFKQALSQWQAGLLPQSDDVQAITQAIQALATDFAASPVNRAMASSDIGVYDAAATRYEQGEHVATAG